MSSFKEKYANFKVGIPRPESDHYHTGVVDGVGPDAPVVYNEQGGGQSASPYRLDLVDPKALLDISKVLKEGADKYGENNWKKISINDHLNHLLVHVYAHLAGDKSDEHLAHAACRAIFALGVELEEK